MNMMNPVFNTLRSLADVTGLPVLGSVSMTGLEKYRLQKRLGYLRFSAAALLLGFAFALVLVLQQPGTRFLRRLIG